MAAPGDREKAARVGRRHFLKGAALGGVVAAAAPAVMAQTEQGPQGSASSAAASTAAANASAPRPAGATPRSEETTVRDRSVTYSSCGGDYIVDVLRSLGIEYLA